MTIVKTPRYDIEQEQKAREYVQHAQTIKIIDQKGKRNENYYQVVIHDQTVYFSYIKSSCVDAYDFEGNFLFSIIVPDFPKGVIYLCSYEKDLFIFSKSGDLFIVGTGGEVNIFSRENSAEKGYTSDWRLEQNQKQVIEVGKEYIILKDPEGTILAEIQTPTTIADNLPWLSLPQKAETYIGLVGFLLLFLCTVVLVLKKYKEKEDNFLNEI
jgi:hypothetical protein